MAKTRFQIAKKDIIAEFDKSGKNVFAYLDISMILEKSRSFWRLPVSLTVREFVNLLLSHTRLKKVDFDFPTKRVTRFTWGHVSALSLALSVENNSYFTHYTAMFLHNLTEQFPKTVYVNFEQSEKAHSHATLSQSNIDRAFSGAARTSGNSALFEDYKICVVNGQFTGRLGVVEIVPDAGERLQVTDMERTLIDIAVRPFYAGGVYEVLNAYRKAADSVSVNKLASRLRKLNYIYPYHQAIGFYLQRSGVYKETQVELLKQFDFQYDFYLSHDMKETEYSKEWRLYYPRGF
jgi:predicted transcriptional regulator of viral defense system